MAQEIVLCVENVRDICPVNNPKGKFIKTNDVRFTILRAILLVVILLLYKYVV